MASGLVKALYIMKCGKTAGVDGTVVELFKKVVSCKGVVT